MQSYYCILVCAIIIAMPISMAQQDKGLECLPIVKEMSIHFNDEISGAAVSIFESPENDEFFKKQEFASLRFYVSPICQFLPWKESKPYERIELGSTILYHLRMEYYHDKIYEQAAKILNVWLNSKNIKYNILPENAKMQIFNLPHSQVMFSITDDVPDFDKIKIRKLGALGELVTLANRDTIHVAVPKDSDMLFRELLDSDSGISFMVKIPYKIKDGARAINLLTSSSKIGTLSEGSQDITRKLYAHDESLIKAKLDLEDLRKRNDQLSSKTQAHEQAIESDGEDLHRLDKKYTYVHDQVSVLEAQLEKLQSDAKEWDKANLATFQAEITKLDMRISALEQYYSKNRSRFVGNMVSELLTESDLARFESWIGLGYIDLELIFVKSAGKNSKDFHAACDNKGPTIIVIELADSKQLIGGYAPVPWTSKNAYIFGMTGFIFNLTIGEKRVVNANWGNMMYDHATYGPTFGNGHDLYVDSTLNAGYVHAPYAYVSGSYNILGTGSTGQVATTYARMEVFLVKPRK